MGNPGSLMVSVSGIRGVLGEGMNPEVAARYTGAFARLVGRGCVVVGRDSRPSGPLLASAVFSALRFAGLDTIDLGLSSTPTVELMVTELGASGGIIITASHNGPEWNALKLLGPDGEFLDEGAIERLKEIVGSEGPVFTEPGEAGSFSCNGEGDSIHIDKILALDRIDSTLIGAAGLTAVVDCVNGAGSGIVPALLERLGVDVTGIFTDPDEPFPHNPEPRPENLSELAAEVQKRKADIGFACDPDADRLVLVDEGGRVCSEELTLALAADLVLKEERGPVAVNMSTSRLIDDVCSKHGVPVHRAKVGEANVIESMKDSGAVIGGEGNGGVIYPALHYGRDAMVGIALVLQLLAEEKISLSEKVAGLPRYHIIKNKFSFGGDMAAVERAVTKLFAGEANTIDGIRIDMENGWVHIRKSNTEPVVRVIAEAGTAEMAQGIADDAVTVLRSCSEEES